MARCIVAPSGPLSGPGGRSEMKTRTKIGLAGAAGAVAVAAIVAGIALSQDSPAFAALSAANNKMMTPMMSQTSTGDPDADFVAMMIPHHQGAVDMAEAELKYGTDP